MRRAPKNAIQFNRRAAIGSAAGAVLSAAAWRRVPGANERIGVGFIGFGLIGKRHVLDFAEQPDAALVAVAETHQGRMEEGRALAGADAVGYRDFRQLLDDPRVDAVVISTPDHWHALATMLACAAGKDVYVEKPLTLFQREGRWMIDVARRHNRVVQVGTQQRSGPHYARARELIQSGRIGKVHSVRMRSYRNIMPGFGRPADCEPPPELDWNAWLGPAPQRPYNPNRAIYHFRWFWDYSGGQMTNLAAHCLDAAHWLLDLKSPSSVMSCGGRFALEDNGETPDTQDTLFEYPNCTISWSHREASAGADRRPAVELFGTHGSLAITRTGFTITPDRRIPPANAVPQFTGAHPVGGPQRVEDAGVEYWTAPLQDRTGNDREQFKLHVRNFLDCVRSRARPNSELASAHQVATACHLANLSLRLGRKLLWDADHEQVTGDEAANAMLVRPYRAPWDQELVALGVNPTP